MFAYCMIACCVSLRITNKILLINLYTFNVLIIINPLTSHPQFDKVGAGLRLGKDKKIKSTSSAPRTVQAEDHGFVRPNGDPSSESVDVYSIADFEVSERFEQMLVSN